uniref:Secreted protein n=1 Tax=Panagrellus redivivus TaxID=6233 RepID=A0A7E4W2M6_PANRE
MFLLFAVLCPLFLSAKAILQCPDNVTYTSLHACDPEAFNPCADGYLCRPAVAYGNDTTSTDSTTEFNSTDDSLVLTSHICCSSGNMSVSQYFMESGVSPVAVPVTPVGMLESVIIRDSTNNFAIAVDTIGGDFEPSDSNTGPFTTLEAVAFQYAPAAGSYLHFLVAVDPLLIPSALYFHYNYPSFGNPVYNLTDVNDRYQRGYAAVIGNGSVLEEDLYTSNYVILVFRTLTPLRNATQISVDLNQSSGDLANFLSATNTGGEIESPLLGTLFKVRTGATMFTVSNETVTTTPHNNAISVNAGCYSSLVIIISCSFVLKILARFSKNMEMKSCPLTGALS